jgi:hypothetical protein
MQVKKLKFSFETNETCEHKGMVYPLIKSFDTRQEAVAARDALGLTCEIDEWIHMGGKHWLKAHAPLPIRRSRPRRKQ